MSYNNVFYLHFVTDLKRAVSCLGSKNVIGAKTFLDHAHKIYLEQLQYTDVHSQQLNIDKLWRDIYHCAIPTSAHSQQEYSEKILTLSSIIFVKSTKEIGILPVVSVISEEYKKNRSVE